MLRADITKTIENVLSAVTQSGLGELLEAISASYRERGGRPTVDPASILEVMSHWTVLSAKFDLNDRHLLEIFGLGDFLSSRVWVPLLPALTQNEKDTPSGILSFVFETARTIRFLDEKAPMLIELFAQHKFPRASTGHDRMTTAAAMAGLLTVYLPEGEGETSTPSRIALLMESMTGFYQIIADLEELKNPDALRVVAIDSGSDKSFDFLGGAKIIEQVKELILGIYDRRVVQKSVRHAQALDSINDTLPVLEKLKQAEIDGTLTPAEYEILKRKLFTSIEQFVTVGAVTQGMIDVKPVDPRLIMKQEAKLLGRPESDIPTGKQ